MTRFRFNIGQHVDFDYDATGGFRTRKYHGVIEGMASWDWGLVMYQVRVGKRGSFQVKESMIVAAPEPDAKPDFVWRVYLREGPNYEGKYWGREFGTDYYTREAAVEAKASYAASFPNCRYFIRRANARYPGQAVREHKEGATA